MSIEKYLKNAKWYHGTTLFGWKQLCSIGVKFDHNIGNELDFGFGFYLTPKQKQAEDYIKNLLAYNIEGIPTKGATDKKTPVVIEFLFCPFEWYQESVYIFKFFNAYDDDFAEFVFHNRVNNLDGQNQHDFHIIFGVMSDNVPTFLIQKYKYGEISREEVIEGLKKNN